MSKALESDRPGIPLLNVLVTSCVSLGKLLNIPVSQKISWTINDDTFTSLESSEM